MILTQREQRNQGSQNDSERKHEGRGHIFLDSRLFVKLWYSAHHNTEKWSTHKSGGRQRKERDGKNKTQSADWEGTHSVDKRITVSSTSTEYLQISKNNVTLHLTSYVLSTLNRFQT